MNNVYLWGPPLGTLEVPNKVGPSPPPPSAALHMVLHTVVYIACMHLCSACFLYHTMYTLCTYFRYKEKLSEERTKLSQDIVLQKEKELKSCQDQLKQCHTKYVVTTLQLCYRHMGYVTLKCTPYSTVYIHSL